MISGRRNSREMNGGELVLNAARFEGADFLLDMEMSVPRKKRLRGEAFYDAGYGRVDEDYVSFLDDLHAFWGAKFAVEGEEDKEEEYDPTYLAFLRSLKVRGTAYMCDVSPENGVLFPIIYEEEEEKSKKRSGDHPDGMKKSRRTPMSSSDDYLRENESVDLDAGQSPLPKCSDFGKQMFNIDDDYKFFLDNLHFDGEHSYFEYGDQSRIYYEASNQQTVANPIPTQSIMKPARPLTPIIKPSTPIPRPPTSPLRTQIANPKQRTPQDVQNTLTASNKAQKKMEQDMEELSAYWRELHSYLRKPYDQKEYNDLYDILSIRKPVSIHKESRRGGYDVLGHLGKSYLDLYPDLIYEIEKVRSDQHKVLNLLRMCMIYVQKIPSLPFGYIKPWRHDLTKTIFPGSSDGC